MSPCLDKTKQAGEMAQWWRGLAAIAEGPSSVPSTFMVAHNSVSNTALITFILREANIEAE